MENIELYDTSKKPVVVNQTQNSLNEKISNKISTRKTNNITPINSSIPDTSNPYNRLNLPKIPNLVEINCSPLEIFVEHYFYSDKLKNYPIETKRKMLEYGFFMDRTDYIYKDTEVEINLNISFNQFQNFIQNTDFMNSSDLEEKLELYEKTGNPNYLKREQTFLYKLFMKGICLLDKTKYKNPIITYKKKF